MHEACYKLTERENERKKGNCKTYETTKIQIWLLMTHSFIDNSTLLQSTEDSDHEFLVGHELRLRIK